MPPRELGECIASNRVTAFLGAEEVLLAIARIPDPVSG